jgi:hypothetical protein
MAACIAPVRLAKASSRASRIHFVIPKWLLVMATANERVVVSAAADDDSSSIIIKTCSSCSHCDVK